MGSRRSPGGPGPLRETAPARTPERRARRRDAERQDHGLEEGEGAPRDVRGGEPRGLVARRAAAKAMILCSQGASAILRRSLKGISGEAEGE